MGQAGGGHSKSEAEAFQVVEDAFLPRDGHIFYVEPTISGFFSRSEIGREIKTTCEVFYGNTRMYSGTCCFKRGTNGLKGDILSAVLIADQNVGYSKEPKTLLLTIPSGR